MTFHILHTDITPPELMNYPFCYEPDSLSLLAVEGVKSYILSHPEWLPVLQEGKMFGVLVVEKDGKSRNQKNRKTNPFAETELKQQSGDKATKPWKSSDNF